MDQRAAHPSVWMFLIAPFGIIGGFLIVTVAYQLSHAGVTVGRIAALIGLSFIPHTWKFLWAPVADSTLDRKRWYVIACVLTAAGIFATGVIPPTRAGLTMLGVVVVVSNLAVTFLGMSVEGLMAYSTPGGQKGRAGGWFQAGNLGGQGVGGGVALWLAQHTHAVWLPGASLGVACLACCLALLAVPATAPSHGGRGLVRELGPVVRDLWAMARSRLGALALVLCFLPIGSGAAANLWAAIAGDWKASADTVAIVTGVVGGLVSAVGCLAGGFVSDRMDRKASYVVYGVLQAACAAAMAFAPRTQPMYVTFTLAYAFITGLTYAGFTAFALEAVGLGAAATKYNTAASLSNMPIAYMTFVDGWAHQRWGAGGMLIAEAACCVAGMLLFVGVVAAASRRSRAAVAA